VGLATLVTGDNTIYTSQLPTRADSPAHRYEFSFPLLNTLSVRDAMTTSPFCLAPTATVAEAERQLKPRDIHGAPVVGASKQLLGIVTLTDINQVSESERETTTVEEIMTRDPFTIGTDATLDVALESLATHGVSWMPAVEGREQKVIGTLNASDIVSTYRASLRWTVRRMRGLTTDTIMLETRIEKSSPLAGKSLSELQLPTGTLVISVHRNGTTVLPRGNTKLLPGDVATFITGPENEEQLRDFLTLNEQQSASQRIASQ